MDLFCQRCDEPWEVCYVGDGSMDSDSKSDGIETINGMLPSKAFLAGVGCPCCKWGEKAPEKRSEKGMIMATMAELLGDDIDGMAAMMEDYEYLNY